MSPPGGCCACWTPEAGIVWLEDVARLDYVRESVEPGLRSRARRPPWRGRTGRLVGYAVLKPEAEPDDDGRFWRRVFWVAAWDRDGSPEGTYRVGCPIEAVDPRTVAPDVPGAQTERVWGGPLPGEGKERSR